MSFDVSLQRRLHLRHAQDFTSDAAGSPSVFPRPEPPQRYEVGRDLILQQTRGTSKRTPALDTSAKRKIAIMNFRTWPCDNPRLVKEPIALAPVKRPESARLGHVNSFGRSES